MARRAVAHLIEQASAHGTHAKMLATALHALESSASLVPFFNARGWFVFNAHGDCLSSGRTVRSALAAALCSAAKSEMDAADAAVELEASR